MKYYMMRVDEETHDRIAEMAKKDDRSITKELSRLVKFACANIDKPEIELANVMAKMPKHDIFGNVIESTQEEEKKPQLSQSELADMVTQIDELEKKADQIVDEIYSDPVFGKDMHAASDEIKRRTDPIYEEIRRLRNHGGDALVQYIIEQKNK